MQKNDLIAQAAQAADVSQDKAKTLVNEFLKGLMQKVADDGYIEIRGFGRIAAFVKPGRMVSSAALHNVKKREVKVSRPLVHIRFKAMDDFKELVLEKHQCRDQKSSSNSTSASSATSSTAPTTPSEPTPAKSPA